MNPRCVKIQAWSLLRKIQPITIGSYVSVRSSRYEACGKFGEHERCIRVARGVAENQLFYNIFKPKANFFSRDVFPDVMSVHNRDMKHDRTIKFN